MKYKKYIILILFTTIFTISVSAEYRVGLDFTPVENPLPVKKDGIVEVTESFWYGCGGCYSFEPAINDWALDESRIKSGKKVVKSGLEAEIIDLRTLLPFDAETCIKSVNRTSRLLILQESQWTGGLGHTISSRIMEEAFWNLESPPVVIGALDTPVPFSPPLEDYTIPTSDLVVRHIGGVCRQ